MTKLAFCCHRRVSCKAVLHVLLQLFLRTCCGSSSHRLALQDEEWQEQAAGPGQRCALVKLHENFGQGLQTRIVEVKAFNQSWAEKTHDD